MAERLPYAPASWPLSKQHRHLLLRRLGGSRARFRSVIFNTLTWKVAAQPHGPVDGRLSCLLFRRCQLHILTRNSVNLTDVFVGFPRFFHPTVEKGGVHDVCTAPHHFAFTIHVVFWATGSAVKLPKTCNIKHRFCLHSNGCNRLTLWTEVQSVT